MSSSSHTGPMRADLFHAGSTCPFCQETVADGQIIVKCAACGSVHHESCWEHHRGCSSYHCDTKVRSEPSELSAELVISSADLENVQPPPPARRQGSNVAEPFLPPQPDTLSRLAVASLILAGLCLLGLWGALAGDKALLVIGVVLALAALAVGVIALVAINTSKNLYGFSVAIAGVMVPAVCIMLYFSRLHALSYLSRQNLAAGLKIEERMPTEAELSRMVPAKANAMRANVVVITRSSEIFQQEIGYGSGIITRLEGQTAFVLTNQHVINVASKERREIEILFYNGETSLAKVEWEGPGGVDLVILSCQVLTLTGVAGQTVPDTGLGPGDPVFAVGNPMNLHWSYTEGVISGIRSQETGGKTVMIYQTQTPINAGNSGGGLYDMRGRLVAINTWVKDKSVAEALNFAISSQSLIELLSREERERFFGQGTTSGEPPTENEEIQ